MHLMAQVLSLVTCHPCSCAFLLESFLLFYFDLSFPVFFFSFHLLHCELYSELDNLIAMQNLRFSANKGSDAYDVSVSLTKPIQRVKFTKAIARHTKSRDQNPSLGYICPGEPHERSPNSPKFEDRSQEETEWQEQGAREAAWKLAKRVLKFKEHERATFFSLSENRCLPASSLKPEEREFVVDSGAAMHMISKKDLSDAEMDILTKSCSPTIVITANGEVQTHEEATVYVKELDIFLTMKVLDNTPAVLALGKLFDENGSSYEWINGQKPHLIKDGTRIFCNTENFVPIVVPGLSSSSSGSSST